MAVKVTQAEKIKYLEQRLEEMKGDLEWSRRMFEITVAERNEAVEGSHKREQYWYKTAATFHRVTEGELAEALSSITEGVTKLQTMLAEVTTALQDFAYGEAPDLRDPPVFQRLDDTWRPPYGGFYRGFDNLVVG